jgi:WS/DGAT/MGAT family acyltransferase
MGTAAMTSPPTAAVPSVTREARLDRASPADLTVLAADRPRGVPENIGVVLVLGAGEGSGPEQVREALIERIPAVPRLRQRLVALPPGLGRPIWVDDPGFEAAHHVRLRTDPLPLDDPALLDLAADQLTRPPLRSRPLWSATVVAMTGGRIGVVQVLHHVIADGIGGITVLDRLLDGPAAAVERDFPQPRPGAGRLAVDAARSWLHAMACLPAVRGELRRVRAAGGDGAVAAPCSLLRPTGRHRHLAVAAADLAALRATGHEHGGTINDVLLAAVAGALRTLLASRGERVDVVRIAAIAVADPRPSAGRTQSLNAPLVVAVPADLPLPERVRRIAGVVRAARGAAVSATPAVALNVLFRAMARTGLYRFYLRHQRRMHTLVSNVHGADRPRSLAGLWVRRMLPLSVGEAGNVSVQFVALSYAGRLTVTAVADPLQVPDLDILRAALQHELDTAR